MISNTNLLYQYKVNSGIVSSTGRSEDSTSVNNVDVQRDCFVFLNPISANLHLNREKSLASSSPVLEGKINAKESMLKFEDFNKNSYIEGKIGDKKLILEAEDTHYTGIYGDKEFDLSVESNRPTKFENLWQHKIRGRYFTPDYFNVTGTINGKEVSIKLPNSTIPATEDERDLLSVILFDNQLDVKTFNGKIIKIGQSGLARARMKKEIENRDKMINEDIKPIVMQGISSATGIVIGAIVTTLMCRFGLKH